jgi:hypothetical protein
LRLGSFGRPLAFRIVEDMFDADIGHNNLFHDDRYKWSFRFTVINLTNKVALDYKISDPELERLALIVRAADVKGQEHVAAEGIGLRSIAEGFAAMGISDEDRMAWQFPVYDALYEYARHI